jgi:anti-sigma28 factor (negative regulator of flagellin synthesis)
VKINDNRPLVPSADTKKGAGQSVAGKNPSIGGESNTPSATPAVNLGINTSVAQASNVVASTIAHQISETEALAKIRQLIEKGEFKIDFPKVAEQMLRDAVSAIDSSKKKF